MYCCHEGSSNCSRNGAVQSWLKSKTSAVVSPPYSILFFKKKYDAKRLRRKQKYFGKNSFVEIHEAPDLGRGRFRRRRHCCVAFFSPSWTDTVDWSGDEETGETSWTKPWDELRRKKTFSAVGFGHDKIPFLSTQHSAVTEANVCSRLAVRNGDLPRPSSVSRKYGFISRHLPQKVECVGEVISVSSNGSLDTCTSSKLTELVTRFNHK